MEINFKSNDKKEAYTWVGKTLGKFYYFSESKKNKGIIKSYVINMTGYSSGNVGKLIAKKKQLGVLRLGERTQNTFATFYTNEDIFPDQIDVQSATLDNPDAIPLQAQIQTAEGIGWMAELHRLPSFERYPGPPG